VEAVEAVHARQKRQETRGLNYWNDYREDLSKVGSVYREVISRLYHGGSMPAAITSFSLCIAIQRSTIAIRVRIADDGQINI